MSNMGMYGSHDQFGQLRGETVKVRGGYSCFQVSSNPAADAATRTPAAPQSTATGCARARMEFGGG